MTGLRAAIYRATGIRPDAAPTIEKRPFYVTTDGKGKPDESLFEGGLS